MSGGESIGGMVTQLLVDGRFVDHPTAGPRGIGRFTTGLLGGLVRNRAPVVGLYATEVQARLLASMPCT